MPWLDHVVDGASDFALHRCDPFTSVQVGHEDGIRSRRRLAGSAGCTDRAGGDTGSGLGKTLDLGPGQTVR
jgi:hypothetical protein